MKSFDSVIRDETLSVTEKKLLIEMINARLTLQKWLIGLCQSSALLRFKFWKNEILIERSMEQKHQKVFDFYSKIFIQLFSLKNMFFFIVFLMNLEFLKGK